MNFIARSILKNCNNDESEAFAQLLALYEFYGYDEMASNDLGRLKICLFQLENPHTPPSAKSTPTFRC